MQNTTWSDTVRQVKSRLSQIRLEVSVATAQPVKIAGIGVLRCHVFNQQIADDPAVEERYFMWAQGFMSGVLLRAPAGQDDTLDLAPPDMALNEQREFLRAYCAKSPLRYYYHAVAALYQRLGGTSLDFLL